jgi:hypothetical protein
MNKKNILSEYDEQCLFVEYLEIKGLKFSKIAQDTRAASWGVLAKNKKSGVRRGVPDMIIIIPAVKNRLPKLLFVEMKRSSGGSLKPDQKEWIEQLNKIPNVIATTCKGFEKAKEVVELLCE